MIRILFVCETNISLSPLIKGIFSSLLREEELAEQVVVDSAGIHPGQAPRKADHRIIRLAAEQGIELDLHLSKLLTQSLLEDCDLVLVMKEDSFWQVKSLLETGQSGPRVQLLMEFSGQLGTREIPDPLLGEVSFEEAFTMLDKVAKKLLKEIKNKLILDDYGNITLKF